MGVRDRGVFEGTLGYGLLGYYTSSSSNSLPTFRDDLSVPLSTANNRVVVQKRR